MKKSIIQGFARFPVFPVMMLLLVLPSKAGAVVTIDPHVFGCGGGTVTPTSLKLQTTVGQPIAGFTSSESYSIGAGFWPGLPSPPVGLVEPNRLPVELALGWARPNPTGKSTVIPFALPREMEIRLEIYDVRGRKVRRLIEGTHPPGVHAIAWDGRTDSGRGAPPGVYFYRLSTQEKTLDRKLVLLR